MWMKLKRDVLGFGGTFDKGCDVQEGKNYPSL